MKKSYLIAAIALALVIGVASRKKDTTPAETAEAPKAPTAVEVKPASELLSLKQDFSVPATVVGDQEVNIVAKAAGTVTSAFFNLGDFVNSGSFLARVDDSAGSLSAGDQGFVSTQVQQTSLAADQAQKAYDLAKKNYDSLKKDSTATSAELSAAKTQRDIAKLQLENARVGLKGSVDAHLITSPIAGFVTKKQVNVGDSVAPGQTIATVSKTKAVKIQLYVDQEHLGSLKKGAVINLTDEQGSDLTATIRSVSPEADPTTRHFLVEAFPDPKKSASLLPGTLATAHYFAVEKPSTEGNYIFPLSAMTVGQNGNYLFVAENGHAKKVSANIVRVVGEYAEISTDLPAGSSVVVKGNSFLSDGAEIVANN